MDTQEINSGKKYSWFYILLTAVFIFGIFQINFQHHQRKNSFFEHNRTILDMKLQLTRKSFEDFSLFLLRQKIDNEGVKQLLLASKNLDYSLAEAKRSQLMALVNDSYKALHNYRFQSLNFYLSDGTLFAAMGERSEDEKAPLRGKLREETLSLLKENQPVSGFESVFGRSGFSYYYPLFYKNQFVGAVELTVPMENFKKLFIQDHHKSIYYYSVKGALLNNSPLAQSSLNPTPFSDEYVGVSDFNSIYQDLTILSKDETDSLFLKIRGKIAKQVSKGALFSVYERYLGTHYLIQFIPVTDSAGSQIGYFISITEDSSGYLITVSYLSFIFVSIFLYVGLMVVAILFFKDRDLLKKMSATDPLTGIFNRFEFIRRAEVELARFHRYGIPFSIILIDVDDFKKLNDTFGHNEGDRVLKILTSEITKNIRDIDVFARWGGEEFILLLPQTELEQGRHVAEKICKICREFPYSSRYSVTISLGVSSARQGQPLEHTVDCADKALYFAKKRGKNRVEVFPFDSLPSVI